MHQNCVLGRCVHLCSIVVLHLPSLFYFIFLVELALNDKILDIHIENLSYERVLLHSFGI